MGKVVEHEVTVGSEHSALPAAESPLGFRDEARGPWGGLSREVI